jgi:hypothetical protein
MFGNFTESLTSITYNLSSLSVSSQKKAAQIMESTRISKMFSTFQPKSRIIESKQEERKSKQEERFSRKQLINLNQNEQQQLKELENFDDYKDVIDNSEYIDKEDILHPNVSILEEGEEIETEYDIVSINAAPCKSELFILKLYELLIDTDSCFLEGAFVFSDPDNKLFNLLTRMCEPNIFRKGFGEYITHDIFLKNTKFQKLVKKFNRGNTNIDMKELEGLTLYDPNSRVFKYFMYENDIKNLKSQIKELSYLCNPNCNDEKYAKNNKNECRESRKKTKAVILFYPFKVVREEENKKIEQKYIYLKLEHTHSISLAHLVEAYHAYLYPKKDDDSGYPYRRERTINDSETNYKKELQTIDSKFYNDDLTHGRKGIQNIKVIQDEVKFYNNFVRSNDEMFIPSSVLDIILEEVDEEVSSLV